MNILAVDDEQEVLQVLKEILEQHGHVVFPAGSVKEAMDAQVFNTYDLIIMDLKMPKINGKEIIDLIHMRRPNLPIFVLSGYIESPETLYQLGASKVFSKPIDFQVLLQAIHEIKNTEQPKR